MLNVIKRGGSKEPIQFDKITNRITHLCKGLNKEFVQPILIAQQVCAGVYPDVTTAELDELAAETAAHHNSIHPDYSQLASNIAVSNLHKSTLSSFSKTIEILHNFVDCKTKFPNPLIADSVYNFVQDNKAELDSAIDCTRDFSYDYFGFKTLMQGYLLKTNGKVIERPQHLLMRVACGIHSQKYDLRTKLGGDLKGALETYHLMSEKWFIHATPTLFNAGTCKPQLSSCFLLQIKDDSIEGIYETLKQCAVISKHAGGIGVSVSNVRASGSYIKGTNGTSNGLVPMLRNFNSTSRWIDQCYAEGTLICSAEGPKQIQEIKIGDLLLTHTGNFQKVEKVLSYDLPEGSSILKMECDHGLEPVKITANHQILALSIKNEHDIKPRLQSGLLKPEMMDAKDLKVGDFVCFPLPNQKSIEKDISELSRDDCKFLGLFIGFSPKDKDLGTIVLDEKKHQNEYLFLYKYFLERDISIIFSNTEELGKIKITFDINSSKLKFKSNKIEACYYLLPRYKLLTIVSHIFQSFHAGSPHPFELDWILKLCNFPVEKNQVFHDNMYYSRISSITEEKYQGKVYDFEIAEDHTYVTSYLGICHNGGGKRKGAFAIYLSPDHADIEAFLDLKKNNGTEELRCRDLFFGLWIPDLFMKRVENDEIWSLISPDECPGLVESHSEEYEKLYIQYEKEGKYRKQMPARKLWAHILDAQTETGTPYMLYKDACNRKSNQQNLGTIRNSNLCVKGDTLILTDKGYLDIKSLENQIVNVWNGIEFSSVEIKKTGENQKMLTVLLDNGTQIECTPYHKFYDNNGKEFKAEELKKGQEIDKSPDWPIVDGPNKIELPYIHGLICSRGIFSTNDNSASIALIETQRNLLQFLDISKESYKEGPGNNLFGGFSILIKKDIILGDRNYFAPLTATLKSKIIWFGAYCDGAGQLLKNKNGEIFIHIYSKLGNVFNSVRLMLQTLGVDCAIKNFSLDCFCLTISPMQYHHLINLGFKLHVEHCLEYKADILFDEPIKVVTISENHANADSFCFNEPKLHKGIFNGVLAGNCVEIIQFSSPDEIAVCNLASIALPKYFKPNGTFDFAKLIEITQVIVRNLNKVIDVNYYPLKEAENSNFKHRPIGIGVQGLADVFLLMRYPFESKEAQELNKKIFETIYFAALTASKDLAKLDGPYSSYQGSPVSRGILQFDMWNVKPSGVHGICNWDELRKEISQYGIRNSLLVAPMPTASTSQILSNNEAFEPYTSNIYVRRTLAGEFVVVSRHLVQDLIELALWNHVMKMKIIAANGSVQNIVEIPKHIKLLYKTVWEMSQKTIINMAADRGAFIDQSQSLNIHMENVDHKKLTSMHFHAWKSGLKSGMYYLRTKPATDAIKFTVDPKLIKAAEAERDLMSIIEKNAKLKSFDEKKQENAYSIMPPLIYVMPSGLSTEEARLWKQTRKEQMKKEDDEQKSINSCSCTGDSCSS